jgi:hypothetical protein
MSTSAIECVTKVNVLPKLNVFPKVMLFLFEEIL